MVAFCPFCGNLLFAQESCGKISFSCRICPVSFPVKRKISNRTYYQVKSVDDVLGGEDAWKHCDVTAETCPKCSYPRAYFLQVQTRSADEPMTNFYRCCNPECAHNWRE
ncbi:DNA-directed RNA polymerase III subunit RPC10-like [Zophobas morio]|uniref:DNA-directed RNA polymerase III subunit RPC10-like n=1 Tax=Zophobas morio TaxID=2755281 RepID=UPI003082E67A